MWLRRYHLPQLYERSKFSSACLAAVLSLFVGGCDAVRPLSPEMRAAAAGAGPTVNAPSALTAVAASFEQINLSWQDNSSNESGFEVHRSTTGAAGTFSLRASTGAGVSNFSDAGLAHSTQYCYRVRAFRFAGRNTQFSAFSTTACATTLLPPVPPAPAAPSVGAWPEGSTVLYVSVGDNSSNEDGFRLSRSTDSGASWTVIVTLAANASSVTDTGTSEQEVCYRVVAFNAGGESPPSNTACTTPPAAPSNLTATVVDGGVTVNLTWTDNSAVENGFEVREYDEDGIWYGLYTLPADVTQYQVACCAASYRIRATKDLFGFSDLSNAAIPSPSPTMSSRAAPRSTSAGQALRRERRQP